jgi:RHH-type rel operon transcriptional repressor/antitoxin RelB
MSEAVSVRLPEDIAKRLNKLAKTLERSKTYIIKKALQEYLEEYEDYLIALHRLSDKEDAIVTQEELVSKLGSQNSFQVVRKSRS